MSQYALPLTLPTVFSADNFFVSKCNEDAWRWVNAWPEWPAHALILCGPKDCGKSHLGHIWAEKAGAGVIMASAITPEKTSHGTGMLVEDIEQSRDERSLLHLFNYAKENKRWLLLTSSVAPQSLPFTLPDLTSRLLAIPSAAIAGADDEVLAGAMRKQFADRQIKVDDDVIAYLLSRIERSLSTVGEMVEKLDRHALAARKGLTIPFVKQLLD
jgi:chromosomal replication initiation ATPase DnaA